MEPVSVALGLMSLIGSAVSAGYAYNRNKELDAREDSAIQRRVADLKAAGLNPLLAAGTGAGVTTGLGMNLDTSQAGNFLQNAFDLKNQREMYKQNQLYTKMMEMQLADAKQNQILSALQNNALLGSDFNGYRASKYDKFGNLKVSPTFLASGKGLIEDMNNSPYFQALKNQAQFNLNQSLFNLKTQGFQNSLELTKDTLEPLIQIGGLLNPIGNFYQAINGRKNYNTSSFSGTWQSNNQNYNYNYRR